MSKLACPSCGSATSRTIDTRTQGDMLRRTRECWCGHRWFTMEVEYDEDTRDALALRLMWKGKRDDGEK